VELGVRTNAACRHRMAEGAWQHSPFAAPLPQTRPGTSPSAAEWAKTVRSLEEQSKEVLTTLAKALICDPALSLKFAYGLLMPALAYSAAVFAERAELFDAHETVRTFRAEDVRAAADPVTAPPASLSGMREDVRARLRSLARQCRGVAAAIPFAWDEATRGEALTLAGEAEASCQKMADMEAAGHYNDEAVSRSVPARSADLTVAPLGFKVDDSAPDGPARRLHNFLFEAEIGALELCAENILLASWMPWDFIIDMSVQAFDEARHAAGLAARLPAYGARLDSYPVSLKFWNRSRGLSLAQRLAVNQRIGEWLGVDSLIAASSSFLASRDIDTAHLMQFMTRDEIRHVSYGNKWLRWFEETGCLSVEEIDLWAHEYRRTHGLVPFRTPPLNVPECVEAGFTPHEIERLERVRLGPGAVD
jgi:uncharacterized ferritin-like protein (DUF455 family)